MSDGDIPNLLGDPEIIGSLNAELERADSSHRSRIVEKFFLAALSAIPWIGGVLSAAETYRTEEGAHRMNSIQTRWLKEHQKKIELLAQVLREIAQRFESIGEQIDERIQSEEYLSIVHKAFRIWDQADTEEKRKLLANVITNAAGTRATSDDVVRLFLDWIEYYSEVHFAVIKEIYANPGSTKFEIWTNLYGEIPREDSAEADLYKFLMRELSMGEVIRIERDKNRLGQYLRKRPPGRRKGIPPPATLKSAFEDVDPLVLTGIGRQFVHYALNEVVTRIGSDSESAPEEPL
jgi:hypothetical protein